MNWKERQDFVVEHLTPEVAQFVRGVLDRLEQENVFDAPGVIGGVLRQMRTAESEAIRGAVERTETLLKKVFEASVLRISI